VLLFLLSQTYWVRGV